MSKRLTITVPDEVYEGLHAVIGARRISRFISDLARPHVVQRGVSKAYEQMAADEAHEREALEWADGLIGDAGPE